MLAPRNTKYFISAAVFVWLLAIIVYIPIIVYEEDDTVLITEREEDLQHDIKALQTAVKEHKLAVNWTKTNTMVIGREMTGCKVEVDGHTVENVSDAVYLG